MSKDLPTVPAQRHRFCLRAGWLWVALAMLFLSTSVLAGSMPLRSGHSGHWYDPDRSGEGFVLEMLDDNTALLYWFTYDEQGGQRWMTAHGHASEDGDELVFPHLVVTRGGRFGAAFDPDQVIREAVGSATLQFDNCDAGRFSYSAFGQSQSLDIQRLAHAMGSVCESRHGVAGRAAGSQAGQSGSWFDWSHTGEGYSLQWMNPTTALLTWYSYDADGHQYWMLGVGQIDEYGDLVFPDMHATRGGRFGAAFDPAQVERFEWGRLSLDLACAEGGAVYDSRIDEFGSGSFDLVRLTRLRAVPCPYAPPMFTDLYELESFKELPIDDAQPFEPLIQLNAQHIADDGSVLASLMVLNEDSSTAGHEKRIWRGGHWTVIPGLAAGSTHFSRSGHALAASRLNEQGVPWVYMWTESAGWSPLDNIPFPEAVLTGSSRNLEFLGGSSMPAPTASRSVKWIWSATEGIRVLPEREDMGALPLRIAEDGTRVIGRGMKAQGGTPRPVAVVWEGDQLAEELRDASGAELGWGVLCDEDCGIVFGHDQAFVDATHPNARQAWFWRGPNDSGYLGRAPDDALVGQAPYSANGVTSDGTLVVGGYARVVANALTGGGYVWTERTGLVPLGEILAELDIELDWMSMSLSDVSANGEWLLLVGLVELERPGRYGYRAAVLQLRARSHTW